LGDRRDPESVPELLAAWKIPETRTEALVALCRMSDLRALEAYVDGLGSADPAVREACRKALRPLGKQAQPELERRAGSFNALVIRELRQVYAGDAAALGQPFLSSTAPAPDVAEYERYALKQTGRPENGERLFFNEQGVACVRCHVLAGRGGPVGPDLTQAGTQFSRAQLIESVLYPSRAVREGYQQIVVEVKGEEPISGALKADTADGLTLVDAAGRTHVVPRASIVDRRTSELSLMPEGLQAGLSLEEFADLIAFLETRRGPAGGEGTNRGTKRDP
jgi:putative heme-binding domain-containing protein